MTNASGQMVYDYSKLKAGQYTYKAYHIEDNYYTFIETTGTIIVKNSTYDIVVDAYPGDSTVINVTVPDDVSGDVTVNINGTEYPTTLVETGVYQTVVALPVGNYTVNATVSNDPKYADKTSDSKDFEVAKNSTYEIGLDVVPGVDGNDTVITVTVPEDVTGNVTTQQLK